MDQTPDAIAPRRPIDTAIDQLFTELMYRGFHGCSTGAAFGLLAIYVENEGHYEILWNEFDYTTYHGYRVRVVSAGLRGTAMLAHGYS